MNVKKPFKSYRGDGKFAYACYSLSDSEYVFPLLLKLNNDRYRIRYDEGVQDDIEVDALRRHNIRNCEIFLAFISQKALLSTYFLNQIEKAKEYNVNIYVVYLDGNETVSQASKFFDEGVKSVRVDECDDDLLYGILTQLLTECREPESVKERVYTYDELLDEVYPDQENMSRDTFDTVVQSDSEKIEASAASAEDAAKMARLQRHQKNVASFVNALLVLAVMLAIAFVIYYFFGNQIKELLFPEEEIYYTSTIKNILNIDFSKLPY
ncbi:MAG: hypothetical protein ACI4IJ_01105 [Acutalibacteraceae bacterium]